MGEDRRTLWIIMGAFFIFSVLIITAIELALPAAVIYPAIYYFYAERVPLKWPVIPVCAPLLLSIYPAFSFGAMIYSVLLATALIMYFFIKRSAFGLAVAIPSLIIFGFLSASIFYTSSTSGIGVEQLLSKWASDVTSEMINIGKGTLSSAELIEFRDSLQRFQVMTVKLFPSIIISSLAVIMWINLLIISTKFKLINIREWKSPDWFVVFFIIAGSLTLFQQTTLNVAGYNLLVLVGQVYFMQGLAIVSVFMDERKWPGLVRWPIYILILIQIYMMVIVAGFGLFDTWFDFRKRIRTPKGEIQ